MSGRPVFASRFENKETWEVVGALRVGPTKDVSVQVLQGRGMLFFQAEPRRPGQGACSWDAADLHVVAVKSQELRPPVL